MAVKFLTGVNLEGNDLSKVGSIKVASVDLTNLAGDEVYSSITASLRGLIFGGGTFDRSVTFNDTIQSGEDSAWSIESGGFAEFKDSVRTPKGKIGILDTQGQDPDAPSGIIVFDMPGNTYAEDNLISGIVYRGDDLSIKNGRDIYFYCHGNSDPELVIGDINARFSGSITCGESVTGALSILDGKGHESTCINATSESWIGGNLSIRGNQLDINGVTFSVDSDGLTINTGVSDITISDLSVTGHIGCNSINVGAVNGVLEFYRNTYIKRPTIGGLEINTDGVGLTVIGSIKADNILIGDVNVATQSDLTSINQAITGLQQSTFTGTEDVSYYRLTWFTNSGGARNVDIPTFYGKGFVSLEDALEANAPFMADAAFIEGIYSAIDTAKAEINTEAKAYADTIYNKLLTNPDETVNSITELLALIESNKDTLIKRYVYEFTGDGTKKAFTCTHNLGTVNLVVTLYDADTNEVIQGDIQHTSSNTTQVSFSTAPENNRPFKLVLLG